MKNADTQILYRDGENHRGRGSVPLAFQEGVSGRDGTGIKKGGDLRTLLGKDSMGWVRPERKTLIRRGEKTKNGQRGGTSERRGEAEGRRTRKS